MRLAAIVCSTQVVITIAYLVLAITDPERARGIVLVILYLTSLALSRYMLWRATKRRRRVTKA